MTNRIKSCIKSCIKSRTTHRTTHRMTAHCKIFFRNINIAIAMAVTLTLATLIPLTSSAQQPNNEAFHALKSDQAAAFIVNGNTAAATEILRTLEMAPPVNAGAWLDIGLLYCEAGQAEDAERVFQLLQERFAPPPAIRQLIKRYRELGCAAPNQPKPFKLNLGVAAGSSSNINSGPSSAIVRLADSAPARELILLPSSLPRSDQFVGADVMAERSLKALPGAYVTGAARLRTYLTESDFSYRQLSVGAGHRGTSSANANRSWDVMADVSQLWIGERQYESATNLQASGWLGLSAIAHMPLRWGAEAMFSQLHYPGNANFDSQNTELRLKSQLQLRRDTLLTLLAGVVQDKSTAGRFGGDRNGHMLGLGLETAVTEQHRVMLYMQRYSLRESEAYNQLLFGDTIRQPVTNIISARYQFQINRKQSIYLQWVDYSREDKIELFAMKSRQLMLGTLWNY